MMQYNEFDIGDIATIVDAPYDDCPFSWVETMDAYMSKQAVIVSKDWSAEYDTWGYHIDLDYRDHLWCGNCFMAKEYRNFDVAETSEIAAFLGI